MEKITKREMFEAIIALATGGEMKYEAEAFVNFCENEIALLDKKAAKAKERAATKKAEGDELTDAVRAAMSAEEFEPIADIAARIEGEDVTVAKVQYRLTQLVKNGEAEKEQITVPGGEGQKARKIMAYRKCV
jgi:crotonobetainyl-CoA:carnitine CoA-transferase CaiB-like acyl-CoA transferase